MLLEINNNYDINNIENKTFINKLRESSLSNF